ncbi:hypothetical protein VP1G_00432 [Cytospora mali]|uniref:Mei5 protein n=1 Tax=Cytospora mali TaxID=578113 RepID=A0A194UN69_CYTMA|nr:hypothetical protein VP1G_00432 [Valsa mali var. pyri (nom. inval.)]
MASSASAMTNGRVHTPDQPPEGMLGDLVRVINTLYEDKSYQALSTLVKESVRLRTRNKELEGQLTDWDDTERKLMVMVAKVEGEIKKAEARTNEKDEELRIARERETAAMTMLEESKGEAAALKKKLESNKKEMKKTEENFKAREAELTKLKGQYSTASQELASLKELSFPLKKIGDADIGTIRKSLHGFFEDAHKLVHDFFGQVQIGNDIFQDKSWKHFKEDDRLAGIPLTRADSQPSRQMRAAAVLRLIALAAVEHLFQPVYLTEEGGELREVLDDVYFLDPPRAQRVRSVLLNIDEKIQETCGKKRVEAASREVFESVGFLLVSPDGSRDKKVEFRRGLKKWCDNTRQQWMEFQRLMGKFTVLFGEDKASLRPEDWKPVPDKPTPPTKSGAPANGARSNDGMVSDDIVAQLWPAFFISSAKDGKSQRFKGGYVLVKSQVTEAMAEARREAANSQRAHAQATPADITRRELLPPDTPLPAQRGGSSTTAPDQGNAGFGISPSLLQHTATTTAIFITPVAVPALLADIQHAPVLRLRPHLLLGDIAIPQRDGRAEPEAAVGGGHENLIGAHAGHMPLDPVHLLVLAQVALAVEALEHASAGQHAQLAAELGLFVHAARQPFHVCVLDDVRQDEGRGDRVSLANLAGEFGPRADHG